MVYYITTLMFEMEELTVHFIKNTYIGRWFNNTRATINNITFQDMFLFTTTITFFFHTCSAKLIFFIVQFILFTLQEGNSFIYREQKKNQHPLWYAVSFFNVAIIFLLKIKQTEINSKAETNVESLVY